MKLYPVKSVFLALLFVLFVIPAAAEAQEVFSQEIKASGFVQPTSFSFVDADHMVVAEKGGSVYMVDLNTGVRNWIYAVSPINTQNDRGLIGITTHPDFANNGLIYLSYTHENNPDDLNAPKTARIVSVTYDHETGLVDGNSYTVLVGSIGGTPEKPSCDDYPEGSDCIASDSTAHSAGGLRFGPDGLLYASIGDGADFYALDINAFNSLNLNALTGKILRLNPDGSAPTDNPYYEASNPDSNRSKVYASGIRNSFRFNFVEGGDLLAGEVGWETTDEINLVTPEANFGWPCYEGNELQDWYSVVYQSECAAVDNHTAPIYEHAYDGSFSITGGDEATSGTYGAYSGKYFFADYIQNVMLAADYSNGTIANVETVLDNPAGPVDIQVAPDGTLYFIAIYTGEIRQMVADGNTDVNQSPVAVFYTEQELSDAPAEVEFNASASFDPDGDAITYTWNFGDGTTGVGVAPTHVYQANGTYTARLTVTDTEGLSSSFTASVLIGLTEYNANPVHVETVVAPLPLYVGINSNITTTFTNEGGGDQGYILYREIYNGANERVYTDNVVISADESGEISRSIDWLPPGLDGYRVAVAFFSDDWRKLYQWNNEAVTFTVQERDAEEEVGDETEEEQEEDTTEEEATECFDWDGDGWGWDGEKGCLVADFNEEDEQEEDTTEEEATECFDWDGDGWGWDGEKGCLVGDSNNEEEEIEEEQSLECPADSDHDGDGWGWDGEKGCLV